MLLLSKRSWKYAPVVFYVFLGLACLQALVVNVYQSTAVLVAGPLEADNQSSGTYSTSLSTKEKWRPTQEWVRKCVEGLEDNGVTPFRVTWRRYVLGDCIKLCRNCYNPKCSRHPEKTKERGSGCFEKTSRNDTFAALYHFRACKTDLHVPYGNLTIVDQIMSEAAQKPRFNKPPASTLVIHLRLGDVIENSNATVIEMLMRGADPWHATAYKSAIKSIGEYLSDIETSGVSEIAIRGGSHDPNYFQKSKIYAGCLQEAIKTAGYRIASTSIEGGNPDEDFFFISSANLLSVSTGGYSRLMGTLSKRFGGRIVGREFLEHDH